MLYIISCGGRGRGGCTSSNRTVTIFLQNSYSHERFCETCSNNREYPASIRKHSKSISIVIQSACCTRVPDGKKIWIKKKKVREMIKVRRKKKRDSMNKMMKFGRERRWIRSSFLWSLIVCYKIKVLSFNPPLPICWIILLRILHFALWSINTQTYLANFILQI